MEKKPDFPAAFQDRMQKRLGEESPAFFEQLNAEPMTSIRLNPARNADHPNIGKSVPWCADAGYLEKRPVFTLDPAFHAGAYYVQEASSMFLAQALQPIFSDQLPVKALDLCAAPGGKSTLIASMLPPDSVLISNEVIRDRARILADNCIRWGHPSNWVCRNDPADFAPLAGQFDVVVVDAPCSGEGLFRKEPGWRSEWTEENVLHCSARQKRILAEAYRLLKPGGRLIYSTCTWSAEENEQNVKWLLDQGDMHPVSLDIDPNWKIDARPIAHEGVDASVYRFYPHQVLGEGFFLAVFQREGEDEVRESKRKKKKQKASRWSKLKPGDRDKLQKWFALDDSWTVLQNEEQQMMAIPAKQLPFWEQASEVLRLFQAGVPLGQWKGKDLVPDHSLAMSTMRSNAVPVLEVDRHRALQFLAKQELKKQPEMQIGWQVVQYNGNPLGWVKILPGRINNYLPSALRIRMAIDEAAT